MKARLQLVTIVSVLNGAGFVGYLIWLATSHDQILYARDGVVFLLPCVAFLFVFACLHQARKHEKEQQQPAEKP